MPRSVGWNEAPTQHPLDTELMGCFAYSCSVSGLPIEEDTPVRFLALGASRTHRSYAAGADVSWKPITLPIRAQYDEYGSVKRIADGVVTEAFFATLDQRAIERPVGENPRHDVPITRGMSRAEWLIALWENRVQIRGSDLEVVDVVQTMIREDIWSFLVGANQAAMGELDAFDICSGLSLCTDIAGSVLRDGQFEASLRELFSLVLSLSRLGRAWARGTRSGPQFGDWKFQHEFATELVSITTPAARGWRS